jgi:hypothetical protein
MPHEEIHAPTAAVGCFRAAVACAGDDQQVEVLVCFDERVGHLHRGGRIDVAIQFADDEQEFALQVFRVGHVRAFRVLGADGPAHPLLVPPDLVHAVVVAAAIGHRHLVEVAMEQQCAGRTLSAG